MLLALLLFVQRRKDPGPPAGGHILVVVSASELEVGCLRAADRGDLPRADGHWPGSTGVDAAFSPQAITIETVLSKIRNTHMVRMHHLQNEEVEAIEFIVEGTHKTSAIIGRPLSDIEFPPCCILAAVVRNKKLYFSVT